MPLCPPPGLHQPDTVMESVLCRDHENAHHHHQFLISIKDAPKILALLSAVHFLSYRLSALPCGPASFLPPKCSVVSSYHNSTHNLLALESVQYRGEKPRIAFGSFMPRLTT